MKCIDCNHYNTHNSLYPCKLLDSSICLDRYVDHTGKPSYRPNTVYKKILKDAKRMTSWKHRILDGIFCGDNIVDKISIKCILNKNEDCKYFETIVPRVANITQTIKIGDADKTTLLPDYKNAIKLIIEGIGIENTLHLALTIAREKKI